jgi:hypothetical protein
MSAADHIHPGQLAMLMPAHQVAKLPYGDAYRQTPMSRMHTLEQKRSRNARMPMEEHMDQPVLLWHGGDYDEPTLRDGHHRMTHAIDTDPNRELLVTHDSPEAHAQRWKQQIAKRKKRR